MRIPLRAGRDIAPTDRLGTEPVIVVNESFANAMWPKEPALGKRLEVGNDEWLTVVGIVGDTKHFTLNEAQLFQGYVPHAQRPQVFTSVVARTRGDPNAVAKSLREAIWRVDRDQPVWRVQPLENDIAGVVESKKTTMWLTGMFAVVALLVATVGIYGVLSYTMSQRTQEIGVRVALGADSSRVVAMVIGEAARLVAAAVAIGLVVAWSAGRLLRSELYGVGASDVLTFVTVSVVLAGVALLACYVPARRASRVDPTVALRAD
jgi:putative ABC transport system permease protein